MKYAALILIVIVSFASCDSSKSVVKSDGVTNTENDTVRIANEELEYEILIIEPGFNAWVATQPPRGYYTQQYLENKNQFLVSEYNRRVMQPQRYDIELYQQQINYEFNVDYGYEVNYLLFNYFVYFQRTFNQKFPGGRS